MYLSNLQLAAAIICGLAQVSAVPSQTTKGSLGKRIVTQPDYSSGFFGDRHLPGSIYQNDQDLVKQDGGARRLQRIDLWCGDYVYQMTPWYQGEAGVKDEHHRRYGNNFKGGRWQQLLLEPDEWITSVSADACDTDVGVRICYLELVKSKRSFTTAAGSTVEVLYCGVPQVIGKYKERLNTTGDCDYRS